MMWGLDKLKPAVGWAILLLGCGVGQGQTLARKNWAGSGIRVEAWWQGAVLYQVDPLKFEGTGDGKASHLLGIVQRLDYVESLGVDALLLSPLVLQADFGRKPEAPPFDPKYGSADDLDQLVQETARRKIRIFVDLPLSPVRSTQDTLSVARFWLSRGVAGLRLTLEPGHADALTGAQIAERERELQKLCATFAGQRVLFADIAAPEPSAAEAALPGAFRAHNKPRTVNTLAAAQPIVQMVVDPRLAELAQMDAAGLRNALGPADIAASQTAVPETDAPDKQRSEGRLGDGVQDVAVAKLLAAALLTAGGSPLLYFGQEIGMAAGASSMQWEGDAGMASVAAEDAAVDSLLNWYRKLSALRHANTALRSGTMDLIAKANPDVVAWVRRVPATISTTVPVLVVCNVTNRPLLVSVRADLQQQGFETGNGMLHTLALSSAPSVQGVGTKAQEQAAMSGISLPEYGVYIGELPHQPGTNAAPAR